MKQLTVYLADDHPIVLKGMTIFIESKNHKIVGTATDGIHCFNEISVLEPDIAFIDINMPGLNGMEVSEKLIRQKVLTKIILLSQEKEESYIKKCKEIGVKGYLLKEFALDEIEACMHAVANGELYFTKQLEKKSIKSTVNIDVSVLTPAEQKILSMIGDKKNTKVIAEELFVSIKTVEKHRSNIISKLKLPSDRSSLIEAALLFKGKLQ